MLRTHQLIACVVLLPLASCAVAYYDDPYGGPTSGQAGASSTEGEEEAPIETTEGTGGRAVTLGTSSSGGGEATGGTSTGGSAEDTSDEDTSDETATGGSSGEEPVVVAGTPLTAEIYDQYLSVGTYLVDTSVCAGGGGGFTGTGIVTFNGTRYEVYDWYEMAFPSPGPVTLTVTSISTELAIKCW